MILRAEQIERKLCYQNDLEFPGSESPIDHKMVLMLASKAASFLRSEQNAFLGDGGERVRVQETFGGFY